MNNQEYDKLVQYIEALCRFCPICGKELRVTTVKIEITNSGTQNGVFTYDQKVCPDAHVTLSTAVDPSTPTEIPDAVFTIEDFLLKDFFDQLREVQAIVDEANRRD